MKMQFEALSENGDFFCLNIVNCLLALVCALFKRRIIGAAAEN